MAKKENIDNFSRSQTNLSKSLTKKKKSALESVDKPNNISSRSNEKLGLKRITLTLTGASGM
jgi:hypothetical protein